MDANPECENMIEYITYFYIFLFTWITIFYIHEWGHRLANIWINGKKGKIIIDWRHLSMHHDFEGEYIDELIPYYYLSGGLFSGILSLLAACALYPYISPVICWILVTVGLTNLVYAPYEMVFLPKWGNNKKYTIYRYSLYISIVTFMLILWMVK